MSYFIAKKLKITPTQIIMRGGDNNVVPREDNELIIERNEKNDIEFCREILGGCIQPTRTVDSAFWCWLRMKFEEKFDWNHPELVNKEFWEIVNNKRKAPKQKYIIELYNVDGHGKYLTKYTSTAAYSSYSISDAKKYNIFNAEMLVHDYPYNWIKQQFPNIKMIAV